MHERVEGLRHIVVPEFVFGEGARNLVPTFLRNFDSRAALVVTDDGVIKAGWTAEVVADLEQAGITAVVFSDVGTNPRSEQVASAARMYKEAGCDSIVAVGGGSVIDCAKGAGILAAHEGDIIGYCGIDTIDQPTPPLICVSTTTTSADVSQFAIISNLAERTKMAIISKIIVPDVSLLDPIVYTTLSPHLTSLCGIDSLSQAVEAYVSNAHSPFTDLLALDSVRILWGTLPLIESAPEDVGYRSDLMFGNLQGGIAFSNASLGLVHATAHAVGGLTDAHHGACVASMLPVVAEFNYHAVPARFDSLADAMNITLDGHSVEQRAHLFADEILHAESRLGIRLTLSDLGLTLGDIPELLERTMRDPTLLTNPRPVSFDEVRAVYERSF